MGIWDNLVNGAASVLGLKEATSIPSEYDDLDQNLSGNQNAQFWRRITQSPSDLPQIATDRMMQLGLGLSDRNPIGHAIGDILTAFVVGEGFTYQSKNDSVQKIMDRFWKDACNDLEERAEDFTREQSIYGEQCILAFVNETSGRVALVSADPRSIVKVVKHPRNTDQDYAVCFSGETTTEERWVKIIGEDNDPASDTFGKLIGAKPDETLVQGDTTKPFYSPPADGNDPSRLVGCFFAPINRPRAATRGRSDLLAVADFVDIYDRLMFDEAERMSFLRAFIWDVTVKGNATETELKAKAQARGTPPPGTVNYHNESELWAPLSPTLGSQEASVTADLILSLIATSVGIPKLWLNGLMDTNRATATEMSDPAIKRLSKRQRRVLKVHRQMTRFALDQAELAGALAPAGDGGHEFEMTAPDMSTKDTSKIAQAFQTCVQALGMSDLNSWIDDETAQRVVISFLEQLGTKVDLADLKTRIEAQKAEDAANDTYTYPPMLGVGGRPGPEPLAAAQDQQQGRVPVTNGRAPAPMNGRTHA